MRAATTDVDCSPTALIQAINDANATPDPDTLRLASLCTYSLTTVADTSNGESGLPAITSAIEGNGGPTFTRALLSDSPAVDVIAAANCAATTDQRGVARPQGSGCDIGAFELARPDTTAPTFGACPTGGPFLLNSGVHTVGPITATDEAGGLGLNTSASTLTESVATSAVGTQTVTFVAVDNAGNRVTQTCGYSVIYNWTGFLAPVDNPPVLNVVKAGSAVPVKFSLGGDQRLAIFAAGYPLSRPVACPAGASSDPVSETLTAGGNSLSYDALSDTYTWKTDKSWKGCRELIVKLSDGSEHSALFQFK